ncbi:MAG: hypothetical protein EA358_00405 [Flavobacteriales bacterium]|nr:MAG: hypothetical protein EA358_00405 [Flavobacteriales bacterium]
MKKHVFILPAIVLFVVFACKKDDNCLPPQICQLAREEISINQVKKIYYKYFTSNQVIDHYVNLYHYENGLLMQIDTYELPDSTLNSSYQYEYIYGKPHKLSIVNSQGITDITITFEEIDGYLMERVSQSIYSGNVTTLILYRNTCQYLFHKTKRTDPPSEKKTYYEVVDGNIVSQRDSYIDENGNEVLSDEFWEYTYFTDRKNQIEQNAAYSTFDFNRNLMKSEKLCMISGVNKSCSGSEYVYEFDESGRVSKKSITGVGAVAEYLYFYE